MRSRLTALVGALLIVAALAAPAHAHHSFSMFNYKKVVTWVGTVQDYDWANPHVHITIVVPPGPQDPAMAGTWYIEGASTNIMFRQGWSRKSFAPGDRITIVGFAMKNGSKSGSLYYAIDAHGHKLYHDVNRRAGIG